MATQHPPTNSHHVVFLSLLPRIERHGRFYFRFLRCPHKKEEAVAEMVALAWRWYVRLVKRGKDPSQFSSALASFAARAVNAGRRICGQEKPKDVLSFQAQRRYGFVVDKLPDCNNLTASALEEILIDNTQTPVDEQVCFRLDFPNWLKTRTDRDRRVIDDLMVGEGTLDVSRRYGLTPGRVSQLRREFQLDWMRFCGESEAEGQGFG